MALRPVPGPHVGAVLPPGRHALVETTRPPSVIAHGNKSTPIGTVRGALSEVVAPLAHHRLRVLSPCWAIAHGAPSTTRAVVQSLSALANRSLHQWAMTQCRRPSSSANRRLTPFFPSPCACPHWAPPQLVVYPWAADVYPFVGEQRCPSSFLGASVWRSPSPPPRCVSPTGA
jgi:hypothetical protein